MLSVCVAVDIGVVMEGAVEQDSVGGTGFGGVACINIRENLKWSLCVLVYVLTYMVALKLKHVHYWCKCWHTL